MINNNFIPIEVLGDNNWYMDISKLSLCELIELRNELTGTVSYRHLDGIIYDLTNIDLGSYHELNKRSFQRVNEKSRRYISKNKRKRR